MSMNPYRLLRQMGLSPLCAAKYILQRELKLRWNRLIG